MTLPESACVIDDLTVDFTRRKVFRADGSEIVLPALSFDTFVALIKAAPAVLTATELIDFAWRGAVVSNETVTQRIRLLRKALQDESRQPRYIETIRNVGYRLIPPVKLVKPAEEKRISYRLMAGGMFAILLLAAGAWALKDRQVPTSEREVASAVFSRGPVTAIELYDQAKTLRQQRNRDSLRYSIDLLTQALVLEPDNHRIRADLSYALSTRVAWYGDDMKMAEHAEHLARQASRNGTFFEAAFALAFSLDAQGKIRQAQAAYEQAIALDPDHYGARASLAYLLQVRGRLVEALSQNMIAYENAPAGTLDTQIASCLRLLGFHAVASEWLDRSNRLNPGSPHAAPLLALDLITQRNFSGAQRVIDKALARGVEQVELYEYLVVLALLNEDKKTALEVLKSVPASIGHRGPFKSWRKIVDPDTADVTGSAINSSNVTSSKVESDVWPEDYLYTAMLEAAAGNGNAAISALKRLSDAGYRDYLWLSLLPPFKTLHNDPAFIQIIDYMQADVDRQREQLLTTDWFPQEWRKVAFNQIGQLPPEEHNLE